MADERIVVADDGTRLWTCATGAPGGVPVILCHGGPGLWDKGEPVAAMVDDLAFVVRWDQRGAGRSAPAGPYTVARCVADLEAVRAAWGHARVVVAGHSWGAGLALRYCLAHPDRAAALVSLSGIDLRWNDHHPAYDRERQARLGPHVDRARALGARDRRTPAEERELHALTFASDFANRARAAELADRWGWFEHPINRAANIALNRELAAEDADALAAACADLGIPALVVHGREDPRPTAGPRELARTLPAATWVELPGVGHLPWAEAPHLLRATLRDFLTGPTDRGAGPDPR